MIVTTRTLTCNFCGNWTTIGDTETTREARRWAHKRGRRTLPNADQRGRLMDECPDCARNAADATTADAGEGEVSGS